MILLAILLAVAVQGCNKRIAVAVDVSGSISVDPVTGKQRPGPAEIRLALKKTMQQYLFRDAGACVGIYRFATNASLVFDYAPVALADTRNRLLAAVETLPFEMSYPGYFTNWEAAISILSQPSDQQQQQQSSQIKPNWLYLVTDSSPTYSSDGEEHGSVDLHVRAAVRASKRLQQSGTGVVGVGMGPEVKDAHLAAISGPCGSLGCFKGFFVCACVGLYVFTLFRAQGGTIFTWTALPGQTFRLASLLRTAFYLSLPWTSMLS